MKVDARFIGTLLWCAALQVGAQSYTNLHTFVQSSDGGYPKDGLLLSNGTLYGTADRGGSSGAGTLFSISTNGSGFSVLHAFTGSLNDGANPNGSLALSGTTLYGTANAGGSADLGVVFSITTAGKSYNNLYSFSDLDATTFTNTDGAIPLSGPVLANGVLYGTTSYGGAGGVGVVYALNTGTHILTVLHHFSFVDGLAGTNADGAYPSGGLVLSGNRLYGTASAGGNLGYGTVFGVNTNGAAFAVLHHFSSVGGGPTCGLVIAGGTLYGMGGNVVYAVNTNGTAFSTIHQFNGLVDYGAATPGLTLSGNVLYGSGAAAGNGYGQAFAVGTNGAGFVPYFDFSPTYYNSTIFAYTNRNGAYPNGGVAVLNGAIYGTAAQGGNLGAGVLFRAAPPLQLLSPFRSGNNFLITFQTLPGATYTVQQNTNLVGGTWIAFTNCVGSGSVTQFAKPTATAPKLFFRVQQP